MSGSIGERKSDHLTLCATEDVGFRTRSTLLEGVRLVHDALPDFHADEIDLRCTLAGKTLKAPLVIAAMTGGTEEALRVNRGLAQIAEERGIAFGLGSQRAMHVRPNSKDTYRVREVAPTTVVLGNLGVVQAREMSTAQVQDLIGYVGADALCIHLNPAMELVQPEGDRDFSRGLETIARLRHELSVPVVAKETGCGISRSVGERLRSVGVEHVDVSGAGGTSWVGVETRRAEKAGDAQSKSLGEAFWDWGVPTAASVAALAPLGFRSVIATGGVATGLDVARALALGATHAGIARPMLRAFSEGGHDGAIAKLDAILAELRCAMLLTGSKDVATLRTAKRIIVGELALWIDQM
ncbi:type 2 isopentenyl-diphosphate Delta-isomerase [Pendulispora brunnea]|uniref:Isopentenyl-diphosphate delta-isomerase n=1 Tax=Pendulispora brunnea TaxID=2905690 RepID=A0ABZ2KLP0_9BACT